MPQRQNVRTVDCSDVQGEGAYAKVKSLKWGQIRALAQVTKDGVADIDKVTPLLVDSVVEWNWVDDGGQPLPLPKDDASVVDDLTDEEITKLLTGMKGRSEAETKN